MSLQLDHGSSSVIEEPLRVLDIHSILDSKEIGISHVLADTLAHKYTVGLSYGERRNSTTLAGLPFSFVPGEPDGITRVRAWRLWKEVVWRASAQVLAIRSSIGSTHNNTQEIVGLPPAAGLQPARHALMWQGQGQFVRQLMDNGAQLIVRANVQLSSHTLVALDRMAVGGIGTVRGYRENTLIRDRGAVVNVELDYPVRQAKISAMQLDLIPFIDAGRASNRGESGVSIASLGLATRLRWKGYAFDLALAKRLLHPDLPSASSRTLQDQGVQAQLRYQFY